MRNADIARQLASIRALVLNSSSATADDLELQSHWARYACVLTAGLLENAVIALYTNFVTRIAPKPIGDYASIQLGKIQNPKTKRFLEISGSFKESWAKDLETFVDLNGRREAIDAIMANRHQIAHGQNSDITIARISNYLNKAEEVLEFIENQLI
ncbi:MAG TPA: HEPN domain-containing protein [Verrucomicrobiae bacterium]|jgi:hypothetical protein|nr:HEPN domain-containing protein [Verrucomicrobiae bacterium]